MFYVSSSVEIRVDERPVAEVGVGVVADIGVGVVSTEENRLLLASLLSSKSAGDDQQGEELRKELPMKINH